jgi:hypothetical protein
VVAIERSCQLPYALCAPRGGNAALGRQRGGLELLSRLHRIKVVTTVTQSVIVQ